MDNLFQPSKTEGFVTLRYVQSDGSSGEVCYDCNDAEATFHRMRLAGLPANRPVNRNQLILDLRAEEDVEKQFA